MDSQQQEALRHLSSGSQKHTTPQVSQRDNILLEDAGSLYSQPTLDESQRLNQHIVGAGRGCFLGNEVNPSLPGLWVVLVVGVQYGKEGRGIYKDTHC